MDRRGEEERQALRGPNRQVLDAEPAWWPTVDGALGLSAEEGVGYARSFFRWGFFLLPFLWAVNCFYFWPVLRRSPSTLPASSPFHQIRPYVMRSAIGFLVFSILLTTWSLTFMIGGEQLFGPVWKDLVMYNLADRLGLTGVYVFFSSSIPKELVAYFKNDTKKDMDELPKKKGCACCIL